MFNRYPYTNFHELNLDYFIQHFNEIFTEWEQLYNDLQSWKTDTTEELDQWRADVEKDLDDREAALRAELEIWKQDTADDISEWETATLNALDAWKTAATAQFEAIRVQAAASAEAAAAAQTAAETARTQAQTAQTAAETAAASVQASAAQIQKNADDVSELKIRLNIDELSTVENAIPLIPVSAWSPHNINAETGETIQSVSTKVISTLAIPFDENSSIVFTGITRGEEETNNRIIYVYHYDTNMNYIGRSNFSTTPLNGTKFVRFLYGFLASESATIESYGIQNLANDWSTETRTAENKSKFYITPEMFGAVGDGITDDTQALQRTFNNNDNKIVVLDKSYLVTGRIGLRPDTSVICLGTIIHNVPDSDNCVINLGNRCEWNGGTFEGNDAKSGEGHTATRAVLYANGKTDVKIKNVKIKNTKYAYCIGVKACTDVIIENNQIDTYNYGGICLIDGTVNAYIGKNKVINGVGLNYGADGVTPIRYPISGSLYEDLTLTRAANTITIYKNTIRDNNVCWEGIDFHGGYNIKITENSIFGVSAGITLTNFVDQNIRVQKVIISNNYIELGTVSDSERYARNNSGIVVSRTDEIVVEGNIIRNPGFASISENRGGAGVQIVKSTKAIVTSNIIENIYKFGFYTVDSENITITENKLTGSSWASTHSTSTFFLIDPPVDLLNSEYNILIENNTSINLARIYWGMNPSRINNTDKIYFGNNKCYATLNQTIVNAEGIIPFKLIEPSIINNIKVGQAGDFIYNGKPSTEYPYIGWICTKSGTDTDAAEWRSIDY